MGKVKPLEEFKPFFELIAEGWSIRHACRETGVSRKTVFRRRKDDPEFAERFGEAEEEGTEAWEDVLFGLARGERNGNVVAAIFRLKGLRPNVYRDNVKHEHEHEHTVRLQIETAGAEFDRRFAARAGRQREIEAPRNGDPAGEG